MPGMAGMAGMRRLIGRPGMTVARRLLHGARWIDRSGNLALLLLGLYLLYMIFAFHRIYRNNWGKTAVKAVLMHGFYMAVMAVVLLAIFIWLIYPLIEENGW